MTENILPALLIIAGILCVLLTVAELRRQVNKETWIEEWSDEYEL